MNAALLLTLVVAAAPVRAQDAAAVSTAAIENSTGTEVPAADQQPNDAGVQPYGLKNFDEMLKADLKQMKDDLKLTTRAYDDEYDARRKLETSQFKAKLKFLRRIYDEKIDFQKEEVGRWKGFVETLRTVEPAERGTQKVLFDQAALARHADFEKKIQTESKDFMDAQNQERDQFWAGVQEKNKKREIEAREHMNRWGAPPAMR